MNANLTEIQIAQAAFNDAVRNSFPADLIARLYADLTAARKRNQKAARKADKQRTR